MGPQDPKDVARDTARDLSGLVGELAALKAVAHHWLTDPEYAAVTRRLEAAHAAAEAAPVVQRSTYQRSLIGCLDCETREEAEATANFYRLQVGPRKLEQRSRALSSRPPCSAEGSARDSMWSCQYASPLIIGLPREAWPGHQAGQS
jgi:hypothetical protein